MNYIMHTEELDGHAYRPEEPVIFLKADSALLKNGKPFFVPDWTDRVDYEGELVVRISRLGKGIAERFAHRYYDAVTVGVDFTARDIQQKARQQGLPWTICKGFDGSAVIGQWLPIAKDGEEDSLPEGGCQKDWGDGASVKAPFSFRLDLNGTTRQQGCSQDMMFSIDQVVSYLSRFFTLRMGDLIFTGTPAGIGPVSIGDHIEGYIADKKVLDFYCR